MLYDNAIVFKVYEQNPASRAISKAVQVLKDGGVIVYPTDSSYALGCALGNKSAQVYIRKIRNLDSSHLFTMLCQNLADISHYAKVDNQAFRIMKKCIPGPYTFILPATKNIPTYFHNNKRKNIGIRVPKNNILQELLTEYNNGIVSTTLTLPSINNEILYDAIEIKEALKDLVDLILLGGFCGIEQTTIINLSTKEPQLIRQGLGKWHY